MAAWRQAIELAIGEEDLAALGAIARSRTEPASRVERARMLLAYREDPSLFKMGRIVGVHHQTVAAMFERALAMVRWRRSMIGRGPGKEPTITAEAKAWVVNLACRKAKELGYPHEVWTTRLLARHVREHGPWRPDTPALPVWLRVRCATYWMSTRSSRTKFATTWNAATPSSTQKMAEVRVRLSRGRTVEETACPQRGNASRATAVAIISYDEKPGIQALANNGARPAAQAHASSDRRARSRIRVDWGRSQPAGRHRSDDRRRPRHRRGDIARANSSNS